jgi:DNA-binding PadR family transcriptional regulator
MNDEEYLPLTETSIFILLSLSASPKHGYAIIKEVEAMSEHRVVLATGTLYSALRRMLDDGLRA